MKDKRIQYSSVTMMITGLFGLGLVLYNLLSLAFKINISIGGIFVGTFALIGIAISVLGLIVQFIIGVMGYFHYKNEKFSKKALTYSTYANIVINILAILLRFKFVGVFNFIVFLAVPVIFLVSLKLNNSEVKFS